jgi:hypothetical protein
MRAANRRLDDLAATAHGSRVPAMEELQREPLLELEERRRKERQAIEEAGGGESEGFELSEEELIEHASHGDEHSPVRIIYDAPMSEEQASAIYSEPDEEQKAD